MTQTDNSVRLPEERGGGRAQKVKYKVKEGE